ncbi:MAG TPA: flagellar FliJ family protein [Candidatus Sulfotelmatobacter sp.]
MPFLFPLQSILHLYQSLEHQQELRLRAANQQVARVRHLIEQLNLRKQQNKLQQSRELQVGTTGAELEFERSMESALLSHRGELESELVRMQQLRDEQQRLFRHARRRRETLDTLREQKLLEYEREASRREQRQADDSFLLRRRVFPGG